MKKKIVSILLSISMLMPFAVQCSALGEEQADDHIVISATGGDDTVKINSTTERPEESETTGVISLSYDSSQVIERDYLQKVIIKAKNISDNTESFYLTCDNDYEDIYMNFVLSGSENAPITLVSGETQDIELSVFAQNAKNNVYDIPVRAYSAAGEFLSAITIRIKCNAVDLPVEFKATETNESTLATEYEVTNVSGKKISDLTLLLNGDAANYAKLSPSVENCELDSGSSIKVKVIPDLSKIKTDGLTSIDGKIVADGGAAGEANFTIDVEGKHIISSYAGNMQIGWDYNEETDTLVVTGGGEIPDFEEGLVPWSKYMDSAKTIVIGNYVERIGNYSFKDFSAVETVYLPKSLYSIGESAFGSCSSLKEINYVGTEEDWEKIDKSQDWNAGAKDVSLICGIYDYYQLNDVTVTNNTASVNMTNITSATVLVEIFDEASGKLCAYGEQSADPMTANVDVAIETGTIPEYFVVKATMLDNNRKLMCEVLENKHYTKSFTEFFKKDISDFEQEQVVNLDEQSDMNFFVASDDVTIIDSDGTMNVVSNGESENTYTISNATEDVLALKQGEKVIIRAAKAADSFAAKIDTINVNDNTVEITADKSISVSDFFEFAKIEMMHGDEGDLMSVMGIGAETEESKHFERTIPENEDAKVKVTFSLDLSVKVSFYYDPKLLGDDYLEFDTSVTISPQIVTHAEDEYQWDYDYALGPRVDVVSQVGIGFGIQPSAVVHLEAMAELTATAKGSCTIGYNYISTTGGKAYGNLNGTFNLETEAKLMMQAGISMHVAITFLRALNLAVISPEMGVQVDASTSYSYTTEQVDCVHDCFICIDGKASLYASADIVILPIGDDALWSKDDIFKYTYEIGDFYISEREMGGPFKFGWGDCENMAYRLDVYVVDKENGNAPVPGETVEFSGSNSEGLYSSPKSLVTDSNGYCSLFRSSGSYTASCRDKVKQFSMGDEVKTLKIVLGEPDPPEDGKDNIPNGGSADYRKTEGRQCTNASRTTTSLYISENDINDIEKIYETGRMYDGRPYGGNQGYAEDKFGGDKYIHHDKNVDTEYSINGNNISVPSSSGLTDVYITDLTEAIPYLKPGQNTIIRQYNTDAGHYDVVASREITIVYSNNKQVSYIETPDTEETRLLPDFAVYPETIYLKNSAIINEANQGTTKIYNRGSLGGWVDVKIADGETELYSETNKYIPEFSMAEINFEYTPKSETSSIVVTLENKGYLNEDRDESNNRAEHVVNARARMVPVVDSIAPENIRLDSDSLSAGTAVIADISSAKDVESVTFKIDETEYGSDQVTLTQSDNDRLRASVSVSNLGEGEHNVIVHVNYYSGQSVETVEATKKIAVSLIAPITFTADTTIVNPTFRIYNNGASVNKQIKSSDGKYILNPTSDMEKNPDQYKVIVLCDGGLVVAKLSELEGSVISLNDGKKISVQDDSNAQLSNLYIREIDGIDYNNVIYPKLSDNNELIVVGAESVNVHVSYKISLVDSTTYMSLSKDVDLGSGDCVIDLAKTYAIYEFQINDDVNDDFDVSINYRNQDYSSGIYPSYTYDEAKKKLYVVVGGSNYDELQDSQSATITVSTQNAVFIEDIMEYTDAVVLDKTNHNKVSFTCDAEDFNISYVDFQNGMSYGNLNPDAHEIYMPDGEYYIYVGFTANGSYSAYHQQLKLSGSDVTVDLPVKGFDMGEISVSWQQKYDKASLYYTVFDENNNEFFGEYDNIEQNQTLQVPVGKQTIRINCVMTDGTGNERTSFSMYKDIEVKKGTPLSINFGDDLTADLKIYGEEFDAGDSMYVYLTDIVDENGARFDEYNTYESELSFTGYLTLVNKNNSAKVYRIPVSRGSLYDGSGMRINIPYDVESGDYFYSMELSNNGELSDTVGISATSSSGGSISPSGFISVNPGESVTFTITPSNGYKIGDVIVDDVSVGKINQYTFKDVTQSHTIFAQFERSSSGSGSSGSSGGGGGGGGGGSSSGYSVRFESNGGSSVANVTASRNEVLSAPPAPVKEGYVFDGWYTDAELTEKYDFSAKVTRSFTLYAKWTKSETDGNTEKWNNPFTDVKEGDWFYETVKAVNEKGLMNGVDDHIFAPNDSITRAMFVTVLYRFEGEPQTADVAFSDVKAGSYYEKAVAWAASSGIVNGVSDTEFDPDSDISREQIATMIYRYIQYKEMDAASGDMTGDFVDADRISDYAVQAISWAVNKAIMNGKDNNELDPLGKATRAEAAAMLIRLSNIL